MSSSKSNPIAMALSQVLEPEGFLKKASNWYSKAPEVIRMANLQKSIYGNQYYVNFGLWLNALGAAEFPKENQCHIGWRLGALSPRKEKLLASLLDLEKRMSDEDRVKALVDFIRKDSLLLQQCHSLEDIRRSAKAGNLPQHFLKADAKRLLGIPVD